MDVQTWSDVESNLASLYKEATDEGLDLDVIIESLDKFVAELASMSVKSAAKKKHWQLLQANRSVLGQLTKRRDELARAEYKLGSSLGEYSATTQ